MITTLTRCLVEESAQGSNSMQPKSNQKLILRVRLSTQNAPRCPPGFLYCGRVRCMLFMTTLKKLRAAATWQPRFSLHMHSQLRICACYARRKSAAGSFWRCPLPSEARHRRHQAAHDRFYPLPCMLLFKMHVQVLACTQYPA